MSKFVAYLTYHNDYQKTPHTLVYKTFNELEDAEKYVNDLSKDYYDADDRYIPDGSDDCGLIRGDVEEFFDDELHMIESYIKTITSANEYTNVREDK